MGVYSALLREINGKNKYVIVYVEKGVNRFLIKYNYDRYEEAIDFIKNNKEELDKTVEILKNEEARIAKQKAAEDEEKKKEAERNAEVDDENESRKKQQKFNGFVSGVLAAAITLVGGHFVAKGISSAINSNNNPTTSTHGSLNPTDPTDSTIPSKDVFDAMNGIMTPEEMYSTENFEKLVAGFVKPYADNNLNLSTEDLTKFVAIVTIDKLAEENPKLAKELFSQQTAEEFLNDAAKTIGVTYMYNHNKWTEEGKTDNFIWISSALPDGDAQKANLQEMENYVKKISEAVAKDDIDEVNKITAEFIEQLTSPDGSLNSLDDGVEFAAQLYFALINNSIGRNYLNKENRDYFNTRASSEQNVSNIFTVYNNCITDAKTRKLK